MDLRLRARGHAWREPAGISQADRYGATGAAGWYGTSEGIAMRGYDHDLEGGLHPKGGRSERKDSDGPAWQAAAAGRASALGPAGLLALQRAIGNAGVTALIEQERSPVHEVINSGRGAPLDPGTRADMEARLGQDFGDVRVHTDTAAHESARSVNAHAYTAGPNIVFQRSRYDPASGEGRHMLAHELTHVVQQRSGPVAGTEVAGGVQVSDPSDRFEREAAAHADRVMSAPAPPLPVGDVAVAQRWDEQAILVQREEGEEEQEQGVRS